MLFFTKSVPAVALGLGCSRNKRRSNSKKNNVKFKFKIYRFLSSHLFCFLNVSESSIHSQFCASCWLEHILPRAHDDISDDLPFPGETFPEDIACWSCTCLRLAAICFSMGASYDLYFFFDFDSIKKCDNECDMCGFEFEGSDTKQLPNTKEESLATRCRDHQSFAKCGSFSINRTGFEHDHQVLHQQSTAWLPQSPLELVLEICKQIWICGSHICILRIQAVSSFTIWVISRSFAILSSILFGVFIFRFVFDIRPESGRWELIFWRNIMWFINWVLFKEYSW